MEKNWNSRSSQSQTKTQNVDNKKSQDASVSKPWPRSNKKRESPGNGSSRSDASRKPAPQKTKCFDKRPKPRGAYNGGLLGGKSDTRVEDDNAEVGSVFLPGSKKQNLNHLLNFQYTSREAGGAQRGPGGAGARRPHGLVYTNTHKHSKELFLQSNCQFVVKADGNYVAHLVDPDIPVNWDLVEQINVRVSEPLLCPICLGETVAGRMTRCGHAYCWPCLLHYFALSEDSQRPCPICFQPIDKRHLRSVQGVWQETIPIGGEMTMRLMRRAQGSTLVEPAPPLEPCGLHEDNEALETLLSVSENKRSTLFSKLLTANPQEVMDIINRERAELSDQLSVESDNPEYCFIQDALNQLQNRESNLLSAQFNQEPASPKDPPRAGHQFDPNGDNASGGLSFIDMMEEMVISKPLDTPDPVADNTPGLNPDAPAFCFSPGGSNVEIGTPLDETYVPDEISVTGEASTNAVANETSDNAGTSDVLPLLSKHKQKAIGTKSKYFYFYQASDGQAVFLEGLEVRILEATWGCLSAGPRELKASVLRRVSGSVGEESRRRLPFLRHLPTHCPYDMVQMDLQPPYVHMDALFSFRGDLEERKRQMARKVREERRRERVISLQEQALLGRGPGLRLSIHSEQHFPAYQPEDYHQFPQPSQQTPDEDDCPTTSSSVSDHSSSLSFAKMASASGTWKTRPAPSAVPSVPSGRVRYDSECSEGEALAAPAYHVSLSEAIEAALLSAPQCPRPGPPHQGKNKKKQKAKVLFSTGIQHHN